MIACVKLTETDPPCIVYWTGRKGLSVHVKTWCHKTANASDGVMQLTDNAIVCEGCERAVVAAENAANVARPG
jgi:hypothetical protein